MLQTYHLRQPNDVSLQEIEIYNLHLLKALVLTSKGFYGTE